jgi:hypothetical protein
MPLQGGQKKGKYKPHASSSEDDSDAPSNHKFGQYNKNDAQQVADFTILECFIRQAIHDFSPIRPYQKTVMYWSSKIQPRDVGCVKV